jgi:hydrocephalus-inducing protein
MWVGLCTDLIRKQADASAGDVGAKFVWDTQRLGEHFMISPLNGFLAPGQCVKLQVTLLPKHEAQDICLDAVRCKVEGLKVPLTLTLTGAAVDDKQLAGTLTFECAVRSSATQMISVGNTTLSDWQLKPVVQGQFWSGPEFLSVPPNSKADYAVQFLPLTTTAEGSMCLGSVFFPIPDGSGLLYRLEGTTLSPAPIETVCRCAIKLSQPLRLS